MPLVDKFPSVYGTQFALPCLQEPGESYPYPHVFKIDFNVVWLRRLVASFSHPRAGFNPTPVRVGFMVSKVALGRVFLLLVRFSAVSFTPAVLHTHSSITGAV